MQKHSNREIITNPCAKCFPVVMFASYMLQIGQLCEIWKAHKNIMDPYYKVAVILMYAYT